jgi:hypothetical protein
MLLLSGPSAIAFENGAGSEKMRLAAGKLLIGDLGSHTSDLLQIETPEEGGGHGIQIRRNDANTDQVIGHILFGNNTATDLVKISAKTDGDSNAGDSGALLFSTQVTGGNLTERMRIDSVGKIIAGPYGGNVDAIITGSSSVPGYTNHPGTNLLLKSGDGSGGGSSYMSFYTSPPGSSGTTVNTSIERMRIDNSGLVTMHAAGVVARDTNLGGAVFTVQSNNAQGLAIGYGTGTNEYRRLYQHATGLYFESSTNQAYLNASGAWVDASDITLKKDIQDIDYGIETVKKLKPRKYKMKSDDTEQIGFIAQEIIEQVPEIVDGKDGVLGVAYGHITSVLTKAIQEQQVIIDDLKARMAALEG